MAPPYYSQRAVFASPLSAFFIWLRNEAAAGRLVIAVRRRLKQPITYLRSRCSCTARYYGDRCEELDACYSSPCVGADSVCVNVPPASFRCHCAPGSYGRLCESADPCVDRPCRHGGTCVIVDQPSTPHHSLSAARSRSYYYSRLELSRTVARRMSPPVLS